MQDYLTNNHSSVCQNLDIHFPGEHYRFKQKKEFNHMHLNRQIYKNCSLKSNFDDNLIIEDRKKPCLFG